MQGIWRQLRQVVISKSLDLAFLGTHTVLQISWQKHDGKELKLFETA